jgi:creatinine amidohydrolase
MRLGELNWMEIEAYLMKDDRLMLVLGSTEQHGFLSVLADVKVPLALADAASQQLGVLVAPPLNFGNSPNFLAYPGTISLRVETLLAVVEDMVRSLYSQGFKRMLILNGHGGNSPVKNHLHNFIPEFKDLKLAWYSWWQEPAVLEFQEAQGLKGYHANWSEAFSFVRSSAIPQGDKPPLETNRILNPTQAKEYYGDGVFGGPYQVDDTIMNEMFGVALKDVMRLLEVI